MLPKPQRLHTRRQFQAIKQSGRSGGGRLFVIRAVPNHQAHSRFGLIVSKVVAPKANQRNLIKRRLRGALAKVSLKTPHDVVIYTNKRSAAATYRELEQDLRQQLKYL